MNGPFGPGPYWYGDGMWWVGGFIQVVFLLILVIAAVFVARWFFRTWEPAGRSGGVRSRALEELDVRYARGEINRPEYLERRADLGGGPPPRGPQAPAAPPAPPASPPAPPASPAA